jgi:DNA-binding MarR family transcriptional regulator
LSSRKELLAWLPVLMRAASTHGLLIHQSIAEQLGLGPTDLKCLDAASGEAGLTAGRLAEITGLSTSATTAALDRLERKGFIERKRDATDRRKVFVASTGRHEEQVSHLFRPLAEASRTILDGYSDAQLETIADFLERLNEANLKLIKDRPARAAR